MIHEIITFEKQDDKKWLDEYFVIVSTNQSCTIDLGIYTFRGNTAELVKKLELDEIKLLKCLANKENRKLSAKNLAEKIGRLKTKQNKDYVDSLIKNLRKTTININGNNETIFSIPTVKNGSHGYEINIKEIETRDLGDYAAQLNSFEIKYKKYQFNDDEINKLFDDEREKNKFKTALSILAYLRKEPGTLSVYDLSADSNNSYNDDDDIVKSINTLFGNIELLNVKDSNTKSKYDTVVTSYHNRAFIDLLLDTFIKGDSKFFNPSIYADKITLHDSKKKCIVEFSLKKEYLDELDEHKGNYPEGSGKYNIINEISNKLKNFTKEYNFAEVKAATNEYTDCIFNEKQIMDLFDRKSICQLSLVNCIINCDLEIVDKVFFNGINMTGTVFKKNVSFFSCHFKNQPITDFDKTQGSDNLNGTESYLKNTQCNFRECRFEDNVYFRDNVFHSMNMEITFEDACFIKEDKNAEIVFRKNSYTKTMLNFFETRFLDYRVEISESNLNNVHINMNSAYLHNKLEIVSVGDIGNSDFEFNIGNRLVLANANIAGILKIANITQFELINVSQFFGLITSPNNWNYRENAEAIRKIRNAEQDHDYHTIPDEAHPLLKACVNKTDLAKQFLMLRDSFHRSGDIVNEEYAYELYESAKNDLQTKEPVSIYADDIHIEHVTPDEYNLMSDLARRCKPLDLHTDYTYWVLLSYFNDVCFVAYLQDKPIGFVSGITREKTGFIWQIGVLPEFRNQGVASLLLYNIFQRFDKIGINTVEVTIDSSNDTSFSVFQKYCKENNLVMNTATDREIIKDEIIYIIQSKS